MEAMWKLAYKRGCEFAAREKTAGGVARALMAGPVNTARGLLRGTRGALYGSGIGAGYGALTGEDDRAILRGALGGALIGGGLGYGSRHLTGETMRGLKTPWKTMRTPLEGMEGVPKTLAREKQLELAEQQFRELMANPETKAQLASALKSMGLFGAGGAIASGPLSRAVGVSGRPSYGDLYNYYLQSAGGRRRY